MFTGTESDRFEERLAQSEDRIAILEAEIVRLRAEGEATRLRLDVKQREINAIHASRAWSLLGSVRQLKYRFLDPLLGAIGITWPGRRPSAASHSSIPAASISGARHGLVDIVCLANCEWSDRFQRPQQLMSAFADAGHRIFFVSIAFRETGEPYVLTEVRPGVYEIVLRAPRLNVHTHRMKAAEEGVFAGTLATLAGELELTSAAIVVQLPFWWPLARALREKLDWPVVYDCMDLYSGFSSIRSAVVSEEKELLAAADAVVVSSGPLEKHARRYRSDSIVIRNGCESDHFSRTPPAAGTRPVIGYYGAISDWFDSPLVSSLAERRPDWDFLLIGSTHGGDISRLSTLPNVVLTGEEPYETLPEWLGKFHVCIIPFRRIPLTEATNPVKIYEMFAGGRAVVSVPIPEVAALAPLVRLASTVEEFEREIEAALREDSAHADARRAFAAGNTWTDRSLEFKTVIEAAVANRNGSPGSFARATIPAPR